MYFANGIDVKIEICKSLLMHFYGRPLSPDSPSPPTQLRPLKPISDMRLQGSPRCFLT